MMPGPVPRGVGRSAAPAAFAQHAAGLRRRRVLRHFLLDEQPAVHRVLPAPADDGAHIPLSRRAARGQAHTYAVFIEDFHSFCESVGFKDVNLESMDVNLELIVRFTSNNCRFTSINCRFASINSRFIVYTPHLRL